LGPGPIPPVAPNPRNRILDDPTAPALTGLPPAVGPGPVPACRPGDAGAVLLELQRENWDRQEGWNINRRMTLAMLAR